MSEKSSIKKRIIDYLEYRGISLSQFYKESNVSRSVLKQGAGLSEENLHKFLAFDLDTNHSQRVNLDWLLRGEGDMMESFTHNQDKSFLEPEAEWGETDKEEALDNIVNHLANMNESYSSSLREVAQAVKKLKDED